MPTCVYCLSTTNDFSKEHGLPNAFGKFKSNFTLRGMVCAPCNQYFGEFLDLYLARGTPDGLNRFAYGAADPKNYKPLRRAPLHATPSSGPFAGAPLGFEYSDGQLMAMVRENVGFRPVDEEREPKWYLLDRLPTPTELKDAIGGGGRQIEIQINAVDHEAVRRQLLALGYSVGELQLVRPGNWRGEGKIDITVTLGLEFARCIGKISFNYLAQWYGARTALLPQFNGIRRFVRYGEATPDFRWRPLKGSFVHGRGQPLMGHAVAVEWTRERVIGRVSFAPQEIHYEIDLSHDPFLILPAENKGHFFDLKTMTVEQIRPRRRSRLLLP
jgi:hypothetical protein